MPPLDSYATFFVRYSQVMTNAAMYAAQGFKHYADRTNIMFLLLSMTFALPTFADPILVVPIAVNNDPADPVLIGSLNPDGTLLSMPTIPATAGTNLNNPVTTAFNSTGELFVGNRHSGQIGTDGTIARFLFDDDGNYIPNGTISGNGLSNVHGLDFSPTGELFAISYRGDQISRFTFDLMGNATANGTLTLPFISALDHANLGVAFSPWGELFVSAFDRVPNPQSTIHRWLFDANGSAIANGSFTLPTAGAHFLEFNAAGELFVPDNSAEVVYRYLFDNSGAPVANGTIAVGPGALGVAFAPDGEAFISHQSSIGILRFLFDDDGNAIPNGQELSGNFLGQVSIYPAEAVPEVPGWLMATIGGFVTIAIRYRSHLSWPCHSHH